MALKWCVHDHQILVSAGEELQTTTPATMKKKTKKKIKKESDIEEEEKGDEEGPCGASERCRRRPRNCLSPSDDHDNHHSALSEAARHSLRIRSRDEGFLRSRYRYEEVEEDRSLSSGASSYCMHPIGSRRRTHWVYGEDGELPTTTRDRLRREGRRRDTTRHLREESEGDIKDGGRRRRWQNYKNGIRDMKRYIREEEDDDEDVESESDEDEEEREQREGRKILAGSTVTLWRVKEGLRYQPERLFSIRIEGLVRKRDYSSTLMER